MVKLPVHPHACGELRMWGFDTTHFAVQYHGYLIPEDTGHEKCKVIQEMQDIFTENNEVRISDYGKLTQNNLENPTSGTDCGDLGFLRMGSSNAWDGYLIYQVPKGATEKDLIVTGSFNAFGDAWWYLHGADQT